MASRGMTLLSYFGRGEEDGGPGPSQSERGSKRPAATEEERSGAMGGEVKKGFEKRRKKVVTVESWRKDLEWIGYETETRNKSKVSRLWCKSCKRKPEIARKYSEASGKIASIDAFIDGTPNVKKTNVDRHNDSRAHQMAHGM